jgi:uncharacterized RDD family membrane protein YckC
VRILYRITICRVLNWPSRVGFWYRVAAAGIDLILLLVLYVPVFVIVDMLWATRDERIDSAILYALVIVWWMCEIFFAATPGKLICGLRVALANGTPASSADLFNRWITKTWCFWLACAAVLLAHPGLTIFSSISFWLLAVGCLGAANDYRQTWHDEIAHTAVFRRRDIYGDPSPARGFDALPPPIPRESS